MKAFIVASSPNAVEPAGLRPGAGDLVVAADGGANWCAAWGWQPDLVIGDMDSVDVSVARRLQAHGVPFDRHPVEKDETDLELALCAAVERGAEEIVIAAALGGRIDHTLGNLALLALPLLANVQVRIVDGGQSIALVRDRLTVDGGG
ncbi:MAG: thiamine diphosphokinase [Caldilineales bacterium]